MPTGMGIGGGVTHDDPEGGERHALQDQMSWVGAALYASGATLVLSPLALSDSEPRWRLGLLLVSAIALLTAIGLVVLTSRIRIPIPFFVTLTSLGAVLIAIAVVSGGPDGAGLYGILYVYVAAYAFYYYRLRLAIGIALLSGVLYAVALSSLNLPTAGAWWVAVIATSFIAGGLIGLLAQRDREQAHREQEQADRLRELDGLKTTFLQAVSHELRTPLAALLGYSMTLRRHVNELREEQRHEMLDRIAVNAQKLDRLLADLLEVDRLARGADHLNRSRSDLSELVARVVEQLEVADRPVHLDAQSVVVSMDAAKIERIVENLIRNATKHTPPGTDIWVTCGPTGGGAEIVVADAGPGIPAEMRESLFEPFQQGPEAGRAASPGTGIGLSLVAAFAELHGGRAWIDERPGGGARFNVYLPDDDGPGAEVVELDPAQPRSASTA